MSEIATNAYGELIPGSDGISVECKKIIYLMDGTDMIGHAYREKNKS